MSKYHNIKKICFLKHLHASRFEADYCNRLLADTQSGRVLEFQVQVPYELEVNGIIVARHIVDFVVTLPTGYIEVHETKGYETALWRLKKKLFQACHPGIKYRTIKTERRKSWKKRSKNAKRVNLLGLSANALKTTGLLSSLGSSRKK